MAYSIWVIWEQYNEDFIYKCVGEFEEIKEGKHSYNKASNGNPDNIFTMHSRKEKAGPQSETQSLHLWGWGEGVWTAFFFTSSVMF